MTQDLYYYETGYIDESYFVFTADAESLLDSSLSVSCDGELIASGVTVEANGGFNTENAVMAVGSRIAGGVAAFAFEFTQSATISHIYGSDLFALSEASISIAVSLIRENNINVSSVFDIAVDYISVKDATSDVDAVFSAIIDGLRSRDTTIETQAAFSFDCTIDKIKDSSANVSSEANLSLEFRVVRDAHLTGTGVASISCTLVFFAEAASTINGQFTQYFNGGKLKTSSAAFNTYTSVIVSGSERYQRPWLVNYVSGSTAVQSSIKKFGAGSLTQSGSITYYAEDSLNRDLLNFDFWIYRTSYDTPYTLFNYDLESDNFTNYVFKASFGSGGSYGVLTAQYWSPGPAPGIPNLTVTLPFHSLNQWYHVKIAIDTGLNGISIYFNGNRVGTVESLKGLIYTTGKKAFRLYSSNETYIDDFRIYAGGTGIRTTSYSTPLAANVNDANTLFLAHYDTNLNDDVSQTYEMSSNISSTSSFTATLTGPVNAQATLSTSSTLSASISHIEGADLTAFTDAAVTTQGDRIRFYSSDVTSQFTSSLDISISKEANASIACEFSQSSDAERTRDLSANIEVFASVVTLASETEGVFADLSSRFRTIHTYCDDEDLPYVEDGYTESFETKVTYTAAGFADLSVNASLTANATAGYVISLVATSSSSVDATAVKNVEGISLQVSEFTQTSTVIKNCLLFSNIQDSFTLFCNGVTGTEINAVMFNSAELAVDPTSTKPFDAALSSEFALTIDSTANTPFDAALSSQFSLSVDTSITASAITSFESIASVMIIAIKEGQTEIDCFSEFTSSAVAVVVRDANSSLDTLLEVDVSSVSILTGSSSSSISSSLSVDPVIVVDCLVSTDSIATELVVVARVASFFITCDVVSTVSADVIVERSAVVTSNIISTISADVKKFVGFSSTANIQSTVSADVQIIKQLSSNISSAMQFAIVIRELRLDEIVYIIPAEDRNVKIFSESRNYTIFSESRNHNIYGESRERKIAGESRIHII